MAKAPAKKPVSAREAFFVGFFRTPKALKHFLWLLTLVVCAGASGLAMGVFLAQQSLPEAGYRGREDIEGILLAEPYPMVYVPGEAGEGTMVVLTGHPKFGIPPERAAELDGQAVQLNGANLRRGDARLFQTRVGGKGLRAADPATTISDPVGWTVPTVESLGEYRLQGEIVDSKCFTGAMKPGDGKIHKGCGAFCLIGGIPPYFVTYHEDGSFTHYLLANAEGKGVTDQILDYVADPVAISGEVDRRGDLLIFRIDPGSIQRL